MFDYNLFQNHLKTKFIGCDIKYFESINSTNTQAWDLLETEVSNGTIVLTDNQTMGKGRRGNQWFSSNKKSLTFSIILSQKNNNSKKGVLALASGLAVVNGIKKLIATQCQLKWPNDIILNNKKLGGILIESKSNNVVIGIGLNVNESYDDLNFKIQNKSISLNMYNKQLIKNELLLAQILNQFELLYQKNNEEIINEWLNCCIHINKEIKFHQNQNIIKAIFKGINYNGQGIVTINNQDTLISTGVIEL